MCSLILAFIKDNTWEKHFTVKPEHLNHEFVLEHVDVFMQGICLLTDCVLNNKHPDS